MTIHQAMSHEDMMAEILKLREQNERLRKSKEKAIRMKVSEKGALSLYGMGRFPVTLYKSQWGKVLGMAKEIEQFIADHDDELTSKDD